MIETETRTGQPTTGIDNQDPRAWPFILPFLLYMLIASRSPALGPESVDDPGVYRYFALIVVQVVAGIVMALVFARTWLRCFPFRIDAWGFIVGVVGVVLWVGICKLGLEQRVLALFGLGDWLPERVGFNPFQQLTDPFRRNLFLLFRFALLVVVVPVVEELFLRGWLVRYVEDPDWFRVKLSEVGIRGISAVAIYACATHPGEAVAAVVWFTLVSVLMVRTGRFWNCVIAHAITNLLLGVYVISSGSWHLW